MTKVYSYLRFSSGRQALGHSLQRQIEGARRWCIENNHELDESLVFEDLGVSAYKGDNAKKGALAGFLQLVEAGKVPRDSILLVESLDRLSRGALLDAFDLLRTIIRKGVKVVSLIDNKEWDEVSVNDPINFLTTVILFSRAHEESSTKAKRVSAAFQKKREAGLPVVSIMHGPGWVKAKADMSGWTIDKSKAKSVRKVFELAASGYGGVSIAREANTNQWPLPWRSRKNNTGAWEHAAISRLLRDRRVLGEWQPKRMVAGKLTVDGEPVKNYFPEVISADLWQRVQIAIDGRTGPKRVRGLNADIFTGLLHCECGKRMERKAPSLRGGARYYCLNRKAGILQCKPLSESVLLKFLLKNIAQAEQRAFRPDDEVGRQHKELLILESKLQDDRERAEKLLDALEQSGFSELIRGRLLDAEKTIQRGEESVAKLKTAMRNIQYLPMEFGKELADKAVEIVTNKLAVEERYNLTIALRSIVSKVVWNGNFFMVYNRDGTGQAVIPPAEMLKPFLRLKSIQN